ncbi:cytosolic iron-sulfur protein assembly protein [Plectosphaerella cucumerina]|uniref:Probable cytosolic iron-sulfur protein assembly protein 1 n=1 Tax=Plectosphaerella cucumerina TaxID=40658 RepID=A0A8K0TJF1_9PEZI|nr:cytosolic iron-sulfur protein assembly protein [Plectosphaerella cucumerina]
MSAPPPPPASESLPAPAPAPLEIKALAPLKPDLYERAWCSIPHPTLPLIATAHGKGVTVFSLTTLSAHSTLTGGHSRSVRSVSWKPNLPPHKLCIVTGSFDSTAGLWRWDGDLPHSALDTSASDDAPPTTKVADLETEITFRPEQRRLSVASESPSSDKEWEFTLVLEGHDSEIKSAVFSPAGAHLATCSRDQTVWIWEDVGANEADDEWETVAVLNEHEGDMKALAWCPDVPNRQRGGTYGSDVLASASYDNTVRIWREDSDGEWVCVAVLEGHEGTVWGLQWETRPRKDGKFPRLLTFSADKTIRIWSLRADDDARGGSSGQPSAFGSGLGGIPNTMRQSLREDWYCSATLPTVHTREIYSASWSSTTGLVASTGGDGSIVVYGEDEAAAPSPEDAANPDATVEKDSPAATTKPAGWSVLGSVSTAHGPYEINHITWCRRYDAASDKRGEEEMLVTSGDEGLVRTWEVGRRPESSVVET